MSRTPRNIPQAILPDESWASRLLINYLQSEILQTREILYSTDKNLQLAHAANIRLEEQNQFLSKRIVYFEEITKLLAGGLDKTIGAAPELRPDIVIEEVVRDLMERHRKQELI